MKANPKKTVRTLSVFAISDVTPRYRRITLQGDQLQDFPTNQSGGYVKLIYSAEGQPSPLMRTYTVRNTRIDQLEIDVDFVLHEHGGPASKWAENAVLGQTINLAGPGPKTLVDPNADWFLLAGDMTALPAISVNLEQLPNHANGIVIIEVVSADDIQTLEKPDNVAIEWIVNPHPGKNPEQLVDAVRDVKWQSGTPGIWVACEFKAMKLLRKYFLKEKGLSRKSFYISSYWKHGISEDEHKLVKKTDAEAAPSA